MNDTDMGMNTANAINALNMGHDVRRKQWRSGVSIRKMKRTFGDFLYEREVDQTWVIENSAQVCTYVWLDEDIYATDWEIA